MSLLDVSNLTTLFASDVSALNDGTITQVTLGDMIVNLGVTDTLSDGGSMDGESTTIAKGAQSGTAGDFQIKVVSDGVTDLTAVIASTVVSNSSFGADLNLTVTGGLINTTGLIFNVLPGLFHTMSTGAGVFFGVSFFLLLSMAALTSTISLLEVPVSYAIDEHGFTRKRAALLIGLAIGAMAIVIAYFNALIGIVDTIFSIIGLPLGGMLICLFLGYVWKTESALLEMKEGNPAIETNWFGIVWPIFIRYICPLLIGIVFITTIINMF